MSTSLKSLRVDDEIIASLDKDINFSNIVNQALREYLNKSVWLPNFQIENYAGLSAATLLERVEPVQYLRQSESAVIFTFYPTSADEIARNKSIYEYANGNFNSLHDQYIYFNIQFPTDFLLFLKSRTWSQVEHAIHVFLCFLYWSDEEKQKILEEQVEKNTLRSVIKIKRSEPFQQLEKEWDSYNKNSGIKRRKEFNELYFRTLTNLGVDPLLFPYVKSILRIIQYPFRVSEIVRSVEHNFEIRLAAAYMRDVYEEKDDWNQIVVNGLRKDDNLLRAESSQIPWQIWYSQYSAYHDGSSKPRPSAKKKVKRS